MQPALQSFPKRLTRKQVGIKYCLLQTFLYSRNFKGLWQGCHHKIIFFPYSKKSYCSITVFLVSKETERHSVLMRKQGFCSASLHQCSHHTFRADHAAPLALQQSLPSQVMLPAPTSIYVWMRKGGRFPPMVFKNEASRRGTANNFLPLNPT